VNRWTNLLGRIGVIVIAVGLALVPVYFIPENVTGTLYRVGSWFMQPETFTVHQSDVFGPQLGMHVDLITNGTVDVYVFELSGAYILEWLNNSYPGSQLNMSIFQSFKNEHTSNIAFYQQVPIGHTEIEYVPTKVTNATLIFVNPSQTDILEFSVEIQWFRTVASKARLLTAMEITIPCGLVLAVFWLIYYFRERRKLFKS